MEPDSKTQIGKNSLVQDSMLDLSEQELSSNLRSHFRSQNYESAQLCADALLNRLSANTDIFDSRIFEALTILQMTNRVLGTPQHYEYLLERELEQNITHIPNHPFECSRLVVKLAECYLFEPNVSEGSSSPRLEQAEKLLSGDYSGALQYSMPLRYRLLSGYVAMYADQPAKANILFSETAEMANDVVDQVQGMNGLTRNEAAKALSQAQLAQGHRSFISGDYDKAYKDYSAAAANVLKYLSHEPLELLEANIHSELAANQLRATSAHNANWLEYLRQLRAELAGVDFNRACTVSSRLETNLTQLGFDSYSKQVRFAVEEIIDTRHE